LEPRRAARPSRSPDDLRIADADREAAISQLSRHTGDGRLTLDEFEERVDEVLQAKTSADLRAPFRGLPSLELERERQPRRHFDLSMITRPLFVLAMIAFAVVAMGAWVLWVAFFVVFPRMMHGQRHHRHHHDRRDRAIETSSRDDDLTLV
jgi:hypothetical protein